MLRQFNKRIRGSRSRKKVSGVTLIPDKKDEIMSVANQLRKEGLQEGEKKGIFTVARNMLHNLHMGIDVIQQATGLSHQEIVSLAK